VILAGARCLERAELALFRIFDGELEAKLLAAYNDIKLSGTIWFMP